MATAMSPSTPQLTLSSQSQQQPIAAPPPTRGEVERKLSFRSAAGTTPQSPKKIKKQATMQMPPNPFSGNESDSSSITSSTHPNITSPPHPASPLMTSATGSVGLSAIAERKSRDEGMMDMEEMELEDVEEEGEDEGEESEEVEKEGGDLQRGMEGERVLKSGYLMKKQERRKAWKRKWFVLRTNKLAYYKDDREYSLKRVLDLKSVQSVAPCVIKKHSFSFGIVTAKRTFLAKASSQDEMDDWVRAINGARRRLSEREEEERNKRSGSASASAPVNVPARERPEAIDTTHQGTYTSVLSSATGSFVASPTAGGYFASHSAYTAAPTGASPLSTPAMLPPSSPMDTTNSLTGQMAKMSMSMSGSSSSGPRLPRSISTNVARREASASSVGSSDQYHQNLGSFGLQQTVSSDEDESYFPDPVTALQSQIVSPNPLAIQPSPVDPNKVILSAYLMKRSKGRGRKVWRKRWFYLTSQGLTYTKSHMDSRPIRYVPLTAVLDALEFDPDGSVTDPSDSDIDDRSESGVTPKPTRQFSMRGREPSISSKRPDKPGGSVDEHLFRIVTAKRTFVLCAPSEEDEIKWLAAFRALLNRQRDIAPPLSPTTEFAPRMTLPNVQGPVPLITQQPPTPASLPVGEEVPPTPSTGTAAGPPILERPIEQQQAAQAYQTGQQGGYGGRGRSATYIAKGAVADVVRRFHPEQGVQNKELPVTLGQS